MSIAGLGRFGRRRAEGGDATASVVAVEQFHHGCLAGRPYLGFVHLPIVLLKDPAAADGLDGSFAFEPHLLPTDFLFLEAVDRLLWEAIQLPSGRAQAGE